PLLEDATAIAAAIESLPEIESSLAVRFVDGRIERGDDVPLLVTLQGISGGARPWTVVRGEEAGEDEIVVSEQVASALMAAPGDRVVLRASCSGAADALPAVQLTVAGIAEFPFELTNENSLGGTLRTLERACA